MMNYMKQFMSSGNGIIHHIEWHSLFRLCEIFSYWPSVLCFVLAKRDRGKGIASVRVHQYRIIKFVWDRLPHLCRTDLTYHLVLCILHVILIKSFLLPNPLLPSFLLLLLPLRCFHFTWITLHPSISIYLSASSQSFFSVISSHLQPLFCVTPLLASYSGLSLQLSVFYFCT